MASFVEKPDETFEGTTEQFASLEETDTDNINDTQAQVSAVPEVEEPNDDDQLPEKYRGKSAAEIARMHRELETRMGEQSREVGDLRRAFDDMVKSQLTAQQSTPETQEANGDPIDFFADPERAVQAAIEKHPALQRAQALAAEMQKSTSLAQLQKAHPDMKEVLSDPAFQDWVRAKPTRVELYQRADQQYDFSAADDLLSTYKERKGVVQQAQLLEQTAKKQEVKQASTGATRSATEGNRPKKVYRRRDIIELMQRDPNRYNAMQDEIMAAYAEGRVK